VKTHFIFELSKFEAMEAVTFVRKENATTKAARTTKQHPSWRDKQKVSVVFIVTVPVWVVVVQGFFFKFDQEDTEQ
jgi:hypothetical protein